MHEDAEAHRGVSLRSGKSRAWASPTRNHRHRFFRPGGWRPPASRGVDARLAPSLEQCAACRSGADIEMAWSRMVPIRLTSTRLSAGDEVANRTAEPPRTNARPFPDRHMSCSVVIRPSTGSGRSERVEGRFMRDPSPPPRGLPTIRGRRRPVGFARGRSHSCTSCRP